MAAKRPVFTENFSRNLADIEAFLEQRGSSHFAVWFDELAGSVVPNLCEFPQLGRSFLSRTLQSSQAVQRANDLARYLEEGDDLRELIKDEYLILYLVRGADVVFLAIRHHHQLSFDLRRFWQE